MSDKRGVRGLHIELSPALARDVKAAAAAAGYRSVGDLASVLLARWTRAALASDMFTSRVAEIRARMDIYVGFKREDPEGYIEFDPADFHTKLEN